MKGLKPDEHIREPFLWDVKAKDEGRATWIEPKYSIDSEVTPLALQRNDPNSIFNHYKSLINLRNTYPALALGKLSLPLGEYPKPIMAYSRVYQDQEIFAIHNLGDEEISLELPAGFDKVIFGIGDGVNLNGTLTLQKNASRVYVK
jgi:glycosidase